MSRSPSIGLFEGYGIELEYMIVDRQSLAVRPLCDHVLMTIAGEIVNDVEFEQTAWSNELVTHVIELKTNGPAASLKGLAALFQNDVGKINAILAPMNAMLMPTAMHPFMNPATDTKLWEHDDASIYEAYNRIFGCQGHGWSNLQSVHINLPFASDAEFGRLHAAIRLVLPLIPALAASSPVAESRLTGFMDTRLEYYRLNQRRVPDLTGRVIPEPAFSVKDYEEMILAKVYRAIAPYDPEGILCHEWLNSRGAIARFDRDAIEIRLTDIQECPRADMAVVSAVVSVVKGLVDGVFGSETRQRSFGVEPLAAIFRETLKDAECALIDDAAYLELFGMNGETPCSAGEVWAHVIAMLLDRGGYPVSDNEADVKALLERGTLARAIVARLGAEVDADHIVRVYNELCTCLDKDRLL